VDRAEEVGRPNQVFERQLEKDGLSRLALLRPLGNASVVCLRISDRVIEDRRIRGQPRYRQLLDVALESTAVEQVSSDVVEPQASSKS